MDSQLAAIYGTGNYAPQETDIEKMAAAELLIKLAAEEGVDLDQFNEREIAEMITNIYKTAAEEHAETEEQEKKEEAKAKSSQFGKDHEKGESEEKEEKEEKSEEKVAEADFLGRVMAHSMVHELREIEKQAQTAEERGAQWFLERSGQKLGPGLKAAPEAAVGELKSHPQIGSARLGYRNAKEAVTGAGKKALEFAKAHPKAVGGAAGGAALLGGGALLARHLLKKKDQEKTGSAFETLAEQLAYNMAKEAGYVQDEQEKTGSALDQALYVRALQICEANGLPVEWNK